MIGTGVYPYRLSMRETASKNRIQELMCLEPRDLGRLITKSGMGRCPVCRGVDSSSEPMAVHENGVQFACGCCRWLPPLHGSPRAWIACSKCNIDGVVVPMYQGKQSKKPISAALELIQEYAGLR